jgi:hypothetical protein
MSRPLPALSGESGPDLLNLGHHEGTAEDGVYDATHSQNRGSDAAKLASFYGRYWTVDGVLRLMRCSGGRGRRVVAAEQ